MRLVTGQPAGSELRAALEIELEPGWKTYWRDPGDAGIAPSVSVAGATTQIGYPVPKRFDDGASVFAGYDGRVALPVTITGIGGAFEAAAFLGICKQICIPVDARLTVDSGRASAQEREIVEAAFAALPAPARGDARVEKVSVDGETVTVETGLPAGTRDAELFVAAPQSWSFTAPRLFAKGKRLAFVFDIAWKPKDAALSGKAVPYVLVLDGVGLSGDFILP